MMIRILIALALLSVGGIAGAAESPCSDPGQHSWDFWLGRWRVTDAKGVFHGIDEVTRGPGGCGLVEHWHGQEGGEGTSINFYAPATGEWTQYWMSPTENIALKGKLDSNRALRTTGTITHYNAKEPHPFRGNWVPQDDGSIIQEFFEQDPATGHWAEWFVATYKKMS